MILPIYSQAVLLLLTIAAISSSTSSPTAHAFSPTSISASFSHRWTVANLNQQPPFESSLYQQRLPEDTELPLSDKNEYPSYSPLVLGRVVGYRACLGAAAVAISLFALAEASFFDGTGFQVESLSNWSETSLPWIAGGTLLASPFPETTRPIRGGALLLGATTIAFHASSYAWPLSMVALMVISIRELWYFGGAYKQECGITLFMLPLMLDRYNSIPFAAPLCAVGLAILAGGKLLEPLEEDLVRSNSEFLAK